MRRLLTENIGLKISALLIAIVLWFFVTSRGQSEMSTEVPIEFKNIPVGLAIMNTNHKTAIVTIRGQDRLMKNIKTSDIRVMVDLGKAKKGEGTYPINKDDIKLPYAMAVTTVSPASVRVRTDETGEKTVPVKAVITGQPESGYSVKSVEVSPGSVTVKGLRSDVRKINEVSTEPIDITGLNKSSTQDIDIDIDTGGHNVTLDLSTVKVTVTITGRKR